MKKQRVTNGVFWVEIPEADLFFTRCFFIRCPFVPPLPGMRPMSTFWNPPH
ncbi:MAG: hypothetical protein ACLQDL_00400 [Spirochaetia bacterium]